MEIFELLRNHFAMCGIEISQKPPINQPFNAKNSTIFTLVCVTISLTIVFLLNEVNTFGESAELLFRIVSFCTCAILYVIIVWRTSKLLEFIDNLADTVNASE